jgi:phosphatidylserine/phosphatidylglycerophosphate/cardiolipin synthase-like enzyme
MSPMLVRNGDSLEALADTNLDELEMVPRGCKLLAYKPIKNIESFDISNEFIAYASPDSTYAVTKKLMDAAKKSIQIGIYDFTADYMKEILLNAMQRGVKVTLMLDVDSDIEQGLLDDLAKFGCKTVTAPSCATQHKHSFFRSSHEKFIIIDNEWILVQSGNYSTASIPFNEKDGGDPAHFRKGNRDMGVAFRSPELAAFFAKVLRKDIALELGDGGIEAVVAATARRFKDVELIEAVPPLLPSKLFPSKRFKPASAINVTPILTPDNYMDKIPDFLASAKESILIEQQYIHSADDAVVSLLSSIAVAMSKNPDLDVRIVLGKIFGGTKGVQKEAKNLENIRKKFKLRLGPNIRFIDTRRFAHCHNKLIVIDRKAVLVSSQNWSNAAVRENREAGLLIPYAPIARYFADIFESDWETAQKTLPSTPEPESVDLEAVAKGNFMEVNFGDYVHL